MAMSVDADAHVVSAGVLSLAERADKKAKYVYEIETKWSDGSARRCFRGYHDFFNFHCKLLDRYPEEAGTVKGSSRTLPYLPGKQIFRRNSKSLALERLPKLDQYAQDIAALPEKISCSKEVYRFFNDNASKEDGKLSEETLAMTASAAANHAEVNVELLQDGKNKVTYSPKRRSTVEENTQQETQGSTNEASDTDEKENASTIKNSETSIDKEDVTNKDVPKNDSTDERNAPGEQEVEEERDTLEENKGSGTDKKENTDTTKNCETSTDEQDNTSKDVATCEDDSIDERDTTEDEEQFAISTNRIETAQTGTKHDTNDEATITVVDEIESDNILNEPHGRIVTEEDTEGQVIESEQTKPSIIEESDTKDVDTSAIDEMNITSCDRTAEDDISTADMNSKTEI